MAAGLIVWDGHVIPLKFYQGVWKGPLTNTWLTWRRFLAPGMIKHYYLNKALVVQYYSLAQATRGAQSFLSRRIPPCTQNHKWPYSSLGLSPGVNWIWSVFRVKSNSQAHAGISDLKKSMGQAATGIYPQKFGWTCVALRGHVKRGRGATKPSLSKIEENA